MIIKKEIINKVKWSRVYNSFEICYTTKDQSEGTVYYVFRTQDEEINGELALEVFHKMLEDKTTLFINIADVGKEYYKRAMGDYNYIDNNGDVKIQEEVEMFSDRLKKININTYKICDVFPAMRELAIKFQSYTLKDADNHCFDTNDHYLFTDFKLNGEEKYFEYSYENVHKYIRNNFNLESPLVEKYITVFLETLINIYGVSPVTPNEEPILKINNLRLSQWKD
jgi:hypothetical protein